VGVKSATQPFRKSWRISANSTNKPLSRINISGHMLVIAEQVRRCIVFYALRGRRGLRYPTRKQAFVAPNNLQRLATQAPRRVITGKVILPFASPRISISHRASCRSRSLRLSSQVASLILGKRAVCSNIKDLNLLIISQF
jgi:hypothetical protein